MFGGVVAQLVAFGLREDAEEGWIAVRYPMAEGKTTDEYGDAGEDGIEEVEGADGAHTDEVEERPFNAQVGERLVQALEDSICAMLLLWFVWHKFLVRGAWLEVALYAPEPTQDIHREDGNARSGGNAGERLFCTGFAVRESVAADHDCNQTCNLRDGAGEKGLYGVKAGVER